MEQQRWSRVLREALWGKEEATSARGRIMEDTRLTYIGDQRSYKEEEKSTTLGQPHDNCTATTSRVGVVHPRHRLQQSRQGHSLWRGLCSRTRPESPSLRPVLEGEEAPACLTRYFSSRHRRGGWRASHDSHRPRGSNRWERSR